MARIAGIDLRLDKRIEFGLTDIFGIGRVRALDILASAKVEPDRRVKDLTEQEVSRIRQIIDRQGRVEGDLRKEVQMNITIFDVFFYNIYSIPQVSSFHILA